MELAPPSLFAERESVRHPVASSSQSYLARECGYTMAAGLAVIVQDANPATQDT